MTGHIFVSYRHLNSDFVSVLVKSLERAGLKIWLDTNNLQGGEIWSEELMQAINDSSGVIVVETPQYFASKHCMRELMYADEKNKPIFPLVIRDRTHSSPAYALVGVHFFDFRRWDNAEEYNSQLDRLITNLRKLGDAVIEPQPNLEFAYLNSIITRFPFAKNMLSLNLWTGKGDAANADSAMVERNALGLPLERGIVLADAGMGKSTLLQQLAVDLAMRRRNRFSRSPLPVYLELKHWGTRRVHLGNGKYDEEPVSFREFIMSESDWDFDGEDPIHLAHIGEVALLIDGLNEIGADTLAVAKLNALRDELYGKPAPKYAIITCRLRDYSADLNMGFAESETVYLHELTDDQIREIARETLEAFGQSELFLQQVVGPSTIAELRRLARIPFFLQSLLRIFASAPHVALPKNVGGIFSQLVSELWMRSAEIRIAQGVEISEDEMIQRFSRLAYSMIQQGKPLSVSQSWAIAHMSTETYLKRYVSAGIEMLNRRRGVERGQENEAEYLDKVLHAGRDAGLLIIDGPLVSFFPEMMQEYFAGEYLRHVELDRVIPLPKFDNQNGQRRETRWDVALNALLTSHIDDSDHQVRRLLRRDPFLVAQLLESGGPALADHVLDALTDAILKSSAPNLKHAGQQATVIHALAQVGSLAQPRLVRTVKDNSLSSELRTVAAHALGFVGDEHAVAELRAAAQQVTVRDERYHQLKSQLEKAEARYKATQKGRSTRQLLSTGAQVAGILLVLLSYYQQAQGRGTPSSSGTSNYDDIRKLGQTASNTNFDWSKFNMDANGFIHPRRTAVFQELANSVVDGIKSPENQKQAGFTLFQKGMDEAQVKQLLEEARLEVTRQESELRKREAVLQQVFNDVASALAARLKMQ